MGFRGLLGIVAIMATPGVADAGHPPARVLLVQPSASSVPANLLRISVTFAAPVEGPVLRRITLRHADGRAIEEPFLPQELWSPDDRILTVLMHPGRVKTGLVAREELGPILVDGDDIVLALDGRPIKRWHVGVSDANGPVVSGWRFSPVRAGTKHAFAVTFDGPIDARDTGYLVVVDDRDRLLDGRAQLAEGENSWRFTPATAWHAGQYRLIVRGTLEDPAGNRLGSHFETPIDSPQGPATDVTIPFGTDDSN